MADRKDRDVPEADSFAETMVRASAHDGAPPSAFGRYEVRRLHGSGGFGAVYAGYDTQLDREVAIKVSRGPARSTEAAIEAFLLEARRIAQLSHPGIMTVYDVGVQEGQCYIICDFFEGDSLKTALREWHPTWREAARLVAGIADALAHAHSRSTVHRDIKPGNVILTGDERDRQPVLVDFGLGLTESEAVGPEHRIAGTPAYMSPEQARGKGHRIDGRTDIYSLGVVLYEMLCRRRPFRAKGTAELIRQIIEDEPQPPRQLAPSVPAELERICLKAMARRLRDRYTTAADMADDLRGLLGATAAAPSVSDAEAAESSTFLPSDAPSANESGPRPAPPGDHHAASPGSATRHRTPQAERRQLTSLCCEIFRTGAVGDDDPEELHEALQDYQQLCREVVERLGGHISQQSGETLLVYFGYPVSFEDAAHRGVRAALEIVRRVGEQTLEQAGHGGVGLQVSAGMHTGLVVAEEKSVEESFGSVSAVSVVGDSPKLAAALAATGEPATVTITRSTQQIVARSFECRSLGAQSPKGFAHPVDVYVVVGETDVAAAAETPEVEALVGRDHEIGLLLDLWDRARDGRGHVALLCGEAGVGKSKLTDALRQRLAADDQVATVWRGSPYHQTSAFHPLAAPFRRLCGIARDDGPDTALDKLMVRVSDIGMDPDEAVPVLGPILSIPLGRRYAPSGSRSVSMFNPQGNAKNKAIETLVASLFAIAERQPVLLIVEDLHWVDPSTLDLLTALVEESPRGPFLIVLTFRPMFTPPWTMLPHMSQLMLGNLGDQEVDAIATRVAGGRRLPHDVITHVARKTDGVPLFVEELTKVILESGALNLVEDRYELVGPLSTFSIPSTLQDSLMARLDRLEEGKEVAQLASVIGREFPFNLLMAVESREESELETHLGRLVHAGLLNQRGRFPQSRFTFKHALIRDTAYQSLLRRRRSAYHERIAEALEVSFPEVAEAQPALLAHHATEGGLTEKAVGYWQKAGVRSQEASAHVEAKSQLERGLELIATLPESIERDRMELECRHLLGVSTLAVKGWADPDVGALFERARELCEGVNEPSRLFHIIWGIWAWRVVRGEIDICLKLGEDIMALVGSLDDPGFRMEAEFLPALTQFYHGDFAESLRHCEDGMALHDPDRCRVHTTGTGQNSSVTTQCYWALDLWHLGYPEQALARAEKAVTLAAELAHPFTHAYALHHSGWLEHLCRHGPAAQARAESTLEIATEQSFGFWLGAGTACLGTALLLQDQPEAALEALRPGLEGFQGSGAEIVSGLYLSYAAEAELRLGRTEEALATIDSALALSRRLKLLFHEPETHRLKGDILWAHDPGNPAAAEDCFSTAIELARRQGAKSPELRATTSLSRLWVDQGKQDEARAALSEVYGWFTEGFDTPDLQAAKALLDSLA